MPSISPRRDRPSLYPDWSTLVDAFRAVSGDHPRPGAGDLAAVVEDAAQRANLCLSFAHLLELLRGGDLGERRARAAWLDALDTVWLKDLDQVQELELERFLLAVFGAKVDAGLPSSSFLAQFPFKPSQIPDVLQLSGVFAWVEQMDDSDRITQQLEAFASQGPTFARQFFVRPASGGRRRAYSQATRRSSQRAASRLADPTGNHRPSQTDVPHRLRCPGPRSLPATQRG